MLTAESPSPWDVFQMHFSAPPFGWLIDSGCSTGKEVSIASFDMWMRGDTLLEHHFAEHPDDYYNFAVAEVVATVVVSQF